jgi:hypothetical protein
MVQVEHGGDAIKAEAVEVVLLQPPPQVGQQEALHLDQQAVDELRADEADGTKKIQEIYLLQVHHHSVERSLGVCLKKHRNCITNEAKKTSTLLDDES